MALMRKQLFLTILLSLVLSCNLSQGEDTRTYSINLVSNTMGITRESHTYNGGTVTTIPPNNFSLVGHNFLSWNTLSDGSGDSYTNEQEITVNSHLTLYAQWQVNSYSIAFDSNGGTGEMEPLLGTYNSLINLPDNSFIKEGYYFIGWNTQADGSGTTYNNLDNFQILDSDSTLYAQWSAHQYTIIFNSNGGDNSIDNLEWDGTSTTTIPVTTPLRSDYELTSWNTQKDGTGTSYAIGDEISLSNNIIVLYAQWESNLFISNWYIQETNFAFPLDKDGDYDFVIDWGDGTTEKVVSGIPSHNIEHIYPEVGYYTIKIKGKINGFGFYTFEHSSENYMLDITNWGEMKLNNLGDQFAGCKYITNFSAEDIPQIDYLTNMEGMFSNCLVFNQKLDFINTSKVTRMDAMFYKAKRFNQPLNNFETSNVASMSYMFTHARSFNQSLKNFNTSKVTNMENMFSYAKLFNQSLSNFDTSKVTNMSGMFSNTGDFNQPIESFKTINVIDMNRMFLGAKSFNQPLDNFNTVNVTNMSYMFYGTKSFNQPLISFDTSNVTNMSGMFYDAKSYNQLLSNFDTSKVTDMSYMFQDATIFNQTLSSFDTSNVTNMSSMFNGATIFNQPLSSFDTSKVTNMRNMFKSATNFNKPLTNFNTSKVYSMAYMFENASSFNQDISHFKLDSVYTMTGMFYNATNFNQDLSSWSSQVPESLNMGYVFSQGSALEEQNHPYPSWK